MFNVRLPPPPGVYTETGRKRTAKTPPMPGPLLDREEYIEQAYFFRVYRERLQENLASQEILETIREEILATTKLPLALDFLRGEILHRGMISDGMGRLPHYFTPFQTYVMAVAEADKARLDQTTALLVLERLAEYLAGEPTAAGLFIYQFECLARNRLGYDRGLKAVSEDSFYDEPWADWIRRVRLQLGASDFADLVFYRSEYYVQELRRRTGTDESPGYPILFGLKEGRIAWANRAKDPLYMFAALQRQLGYPKVPHVRPGANKPILHPAVEQRLQQIEKRIILIESELKGNVDLSEFLARPPSFGDDPAQA